MIKRKKIAAVVLATTLAISSLTGCGAEKFDLKQNGEKPVITVDGESMSFSEANFQARLLQQQYESYYGTDIWKTEGQDKQTIEQSVKAALLEQLKSYRVILNHAKDYDATLTEEEAKTLKEQAEAFIGQMTDEFKALTDVNEEQLEEYVKQSLIAQKVSIEAGKEADVKVTDEEARQVKVNYVVFKVDTDAKKAEKTKAKQQATKLMNQATKTKNLAVSAKAMKEEVTEATLGKNNDSIPEELVTAALKLKKGEITKPIEIDYGYYVMQCMEENDKEATKTAKEQMLSEKQTEYFTNTTLPKWEDDAKITVDEKLWDTIQFAGNPVVKVESTTEESTTAAENTTAAESTTTAEATTAK